MAKFCSNCGKELDENTAICLKCGVIVGNNSQNNSSTANNQEKEKKKGISTWAIVLIVLGCVILIPTMLIIIIAVTAYNVISNTKFDINDYIEETVTQIGTIGDTLATDTFKITLTDALLYDSIGEDIIEIPVEGKEYLVFFFNVENVSRGTEYIAGFDFNGYVDGYTTSVKYLFNDIDGFEELGTDLAPGMKTKGYVAFEVDTTWQEFELHFSESLDFEGELVFTVVNEEDSNITGA